MSRDAVKGNTAATVSPGGSTATLIKSRQRKGSVLVNNRGRDTGRASCGTAERGTIFPDVCSTRAVRIIFVRNAAGLT